MYKDEKYSIEPFTYHDIDKIKSIVLNELKQDKDKFIKFKDKYESKLDSIFIESLVELYISGEYTFDNIYYSALDSCKTLNLV